MEEEKLNEVKKEITYEDLKRVNETIKTTPIKGKDYAEVNQRIKAYRMLHPNGLIETQLIKDENGVCTFRAIVYDENFKRLATGTAQEKEDSSFINKTSYIENCETSAIGRALGIAGFGIDTSVASAEEVANAINNQEEQKEERKATPKQIEVLKQNYKDNNLKKLLEFNNLEKIEDISMTRASDLISQLKKKGNK